MRVQWTLPSTSVPRDMYLPGVFGPADSGGFRLPKTAVPNYDTLGSRLFSL